MISLSHVQRLFFARTPADMRKQAYGLATLVESHLGKDPLSGDVFLFVSCKNNFRNRVVTDQSIECVENKWFTRELLYILAHKSLRSASSRNDSN